MKEVLLLLLLLLLLERENESRKRETNEKEEDEETRDLVDRSSGRGRGVRRPVGGRESERKRNDEEDWTRLWEHQTASGEVAAAAGPLTVCVPEKVQCPPSKAGYIGIKRAMSTISRFVLGLSLSAPDAAKRKGRRILLRAPRDEIR